MRETRRSLEMLTRASDARYCCYLALTRDAWFDSMRNEPEFRQIVGRQRDSYQSMTAMFREAGGPAILGESAVSLSQ